MSWIEVTLLADGEAAEAIADLFQRYGYQGVAIEHPSPNIDAWEDELPVPEQLLLRAYLPQDSQAETIKHDLEEGLFQLSKLYPVPTKPTYKLVQEEDWSEAWKVNYHPLRIGQQIYICPAWITPEADPEDIVIVLDPGMAFGTGTHPSTQLCLIALEAQPRPLPERVLDLGCGSGILAIAAAKLGANNILALDLDEIAVTATQENAEHNHVLPQITARQGSLDDLTATAQRFGLILVNILAKTIIRMCAAGLGEIVEPGGVGIFGGIIIEQAADVEAALRECGLVPYQRHIQGDWVVIEARRKAD